MRGNSSVGALVIQPRQGPVMLPPQNFVEPKSAHSVTITKQGYFLFFVFFFFLLCCPCCPGIFYVQQAGLCLPSGGIKGLCDGHINHCHMNSKVAPDILFIVIITIIVIIPL